MKRRLAPLDDLPEIEDELRHPNPDIYTSSLAGFYARIAAQPNTNEESARLYLTWAHGSERRWRRRPRQ